MKKCCYYGLLFCKRQLKKPSYVFILCLFPIITIFFKQDASHSSGTIKVALYLEEASDFSQTLVDKLVTKNSLVSFYVASSLDVLYDDVITKKAECGYVIPGDLLESLDQNKRNNLVTLVCSPSSTMNFVTNEVVYAELFEEYSLHLLLSYFETNNPLTNYQTTQTKEQLEEAYRFHMNNKSTFGFDFENGYDSFETNKTSLILASIPGLISIIILLAGFCGSLQYYEDKKNNVFQNIPYTYINIIRFLSIASPVFMATIIGYICLLISNRRYFSIQQLSYLLLYSFIVIAFVILLTILIKQKNMFASFIPIILIGCLLFTPIFIDFTQFVTFLKPLQYLFVPYYYLSFALK